MRIQNLFPIIPQLKSMQVITVFVIIKKCIGFLFQASFLDVSEISFTKLLPLRTECNVFWIEERLFISTILNLSLIIDMSFYIPKHKKLHLCNLHPSWIDYKTCWKTFYKSFFFAVVSTLLYHTFFHSESRTSMGFNETIIFKFHFLHGYECC